MKKKWVWILAIMFLVGCGGMQFPDTPRGDYASALTLYNNTVQAYVDVLKVQSTDIKVEWKTNINPKIKIAGDALAVWGSSVGSDQDQAKEIIYLRLFQQLLTLLINNGIIGG